MRVNITSLVTASALLVFTAAAQAQTAAPASSAAPVAASPAHNTDDDVLCRSMATAGSFIEKRVCHTQREWKQISAQSQATMHNMTDQRSMPGAH